MRLYALLAAAVLAGCVDYNDTEVNTRPAAASSKDRAFVQSAIIDHMKDPAAAQLRNLRSFDLSNNQGRAVCGEVNGKNSFGAYIGFKPFYLRLKNDVVVARYVGSGLPNDYEAAQAVEACSMAATGRMKVRGASSPFTID